MFDHVLGRPLKLSLFGILIFLGAASSGRGEGKQWGDKSLETAFGKTYSVKIKLFSGERPPSGAEDQKLMEVLAQWYVYRTSWLSAKDNPQEMAKLHETLERDLINPLLGASSAKANRVFVNQLGKYMAKCFRDVLTSDFAENRVAIVNAALMLPPVARLKQEDVGDLLVELMKDKNRHDAVKLYAAKALGEFFPARIMTVDDDPNDKRLNHKFKRDTERLQALVGFIDRKGPLPADEGEREAIRYIRREAVMTLARIGVPALAALKKKGSVDGPAAYELLRVLVKGKGAYEPPTALSERVEAALGLCHLKDPTGTLDYNPGAAVYAVGVCFDDYATEFSKDFANIFGRKDTKNIKPDSKIPTMAWRIQSERFKQAMKDLAANTKGTPAQANAQMLERAIGPMATNIAAYNQVSNELVAYRKMVKTLAPKTGQLYKLKAPQIDPESLQGAAAADGN